MYLQKLLRILVHPYRNNGGQIILNRYITTVDHNEIDRFSQLSGDWWDENGQLKPLHSMNRLRVPWIRDTLQNYVGNRTAKVLPLKNVSVVEVGCGAGILCEPLARLGATVIGIDVSEENVLIAKSHWEKSEKSSNVGNLRYFATTVEEFSSKNDSIEKFDAVVASEVLEHVADREIFLKSCVKLLKPEGILFITTLNRTLRSKILGIYLAENVLNIVPKGIHDWDKFISPDSLELLLEWQNCSVRMVHGLLYNPLTNNWRWIRDTGVNYALHAIKNK